MFRLTSYMHQLLDSGPDSGPARARRRKGPVKPVVIWNLTRRCNLRCRHCYTSSADVAFPGELSKEQALGVLEDLREFGIPALILSGGEPLSSPHFQAVAERARELEFPFLALSTNGTRIFGDAARLIADLEFDYVGISLDGIGKTNDRFRGADGAFDDGLRGVRECKRRGVRVGLRFTLTEGNAGELEGMLDLCESEGVDKFYLSHLVYAGRGNKHRGDDAERARSRSAMDMLIDRGWSAVSGGRPLEIVTGNNDADAVYFLQWVERNFDADAASRVRASLEAWGGNSSGLGVANIAPTGSVHPDTYWSDYPVGNVKSARFSEIWTGDDPMLRALRKRPRPLKGRCGACVHQSVCGGNTRVRAMQLTGDPWAEDPACYLDNDEIGAPDLDEAERLEVTPFLGKGRDPERVFA